ncbi:MAG TPA: Chromate resistance protein ChrB, partial [Candidatus Binatia bacterium]|nr:Chromate resistance protein ChrB [Candidatus Binatia bacterium]
MTPPNAVAPSPSESWHLLVHRLPATPLYLRARVLAALRRAGAVALKKAVYALPASAGRLDRLQEIAEEIRAAGGDAFVCECRFPEARDRDAVVAAWREQRAADYERLQEDSRDERAASRLPALRARLAELRAL